MLQLEVLIKGLFEKSRFLQMLRHFIVFEYDGSGQVIKKMAGYHQFHAVVRAVETTVSASKPEGDRRSGVVGIRRDRAKASPWPSTPGQWCCIPRWRIQRFW